LKYYVLGARNYPSRRCFRKVERKTKCNSGTIRTDGDVPKIFRVGGWERSSISWNQRPHAKVLIWSQLPINWYLILKFWTIKSNIF